MTGYTKTMLVCKFFRNFCNSKTVLDHSVNTSDHTDTTISISALILWYRY